MISVTTLAFISESTTGAALTVLFSVNQVSASSSIAVAKVSLALSASSVTGAIFAGAVAFFGKN